MGSPAILVIGVKAEGSYAEGRRKTRKKGSADKVLWHEDDITADSDAKQKTSITWSVVPYNTGV